MTTAVYARISDDRKDGVGVENQLATCRAWCATEGWAPVAEYVDNDVSASVYARKPRKAYKALLRAVEAGEVERIVCFATDRLYRQPLDLEVLIPLAERVEVRSKVGGVIDLSCAGGRLNARVQTALAANESEVKSERILLSQQRARDNGQPHGGPRPFGWLAIGEEGRNGGRSWDPRQHDPDEAALIRQAADDVLKGDTITTIAKRWNAAGVPQTRGGAGWHPTTILSVLRSPRNAGLSGYKGSAAPGDWPPIVDVDTWERVCFELDRRRSRFAIAPRRRSLLSGVLVCGKCDKPLSHGRTRGTVTYRCKAGPGARGCGRLQIAAALLEALVTEAVFVYVDGDELQAALASRDDTKVVAIRTQLTALDVRRGELADAFADGGDAKALRLATDGLDRQRKALEASLGEASARSPLEGYGDAPGALRAAWPTMTTDQRRSVILAAFGAVTIKPATTRGRQFDSSRVSFGKPSLVPQRTDLAARL
jgi:site-specific DNA recombinase